MKKFDCFWQPPARPGDLALPNGAIHIWCAALEQPEILAQRFSGMLSEDERCRAGRFCFDHLKRRFIVGRGVLRWLLGQYTGLAPDRLQFSYNAHGKPALAEAFGSEALHFNVSHSEELALFAFAHGLEIGIDVEYLRPLADCEGIAARFFSAYESRVFRALAPRHKQPAFFNCWTRKEAYLKARGHGLSSSLQAFDVSLAPGEPARLLRTSGDPQEASAWSLQDLRPAAGYAAACAVRGPIRDLVCRQWTAALMN